MFFPNVCAVMGNCDFGTQRSSALVCETDGVTILATHGHLSDVKYDYSFLLEFYLILARRDDLYSFLTLSHLSAMVLLPACITRAETCIRSLQCDKKSIIETVIMKFAHAFQICLVCITLKDCRNASLKLLCDSLYSLLLCFSVRT
ncbi:MAG: hypothetical protein IJJ22_01475, partial [Oscillospiraceae bacterium]|nr:hypothetical protein [Oscillospiraceae bacterium]